MNAGAESASVTGGTSDLKYDGANYINAKAGILFAYNIKNSNGLLIEPLLELAYRQELTGTDKVTYGGATEKSNLKGGNAEVNAGLNMQLTDRLYWYALGSYEAGSKISGWGLNAGIRLSFGNSENSNSKQKYKSYSWNNDYKPNKEKKVKEDKSYKDNYYKDSYKQKSKVKKEKVNKKEKARKDEEQRKKSNDADRNYFMRMMN